ncbi:hypothetical protein V6N12_009243 [Hibiscus sabdariffa]|uniref:Uncharacterized protein n=1 Tax=Hibiscus sabdariffa TaxID=183260 RepID=A0ABR2BIE1_9ROSI
MDVGSDNSGESPTHEDKVEHDAAARPSLTSGDATLVASSTAEKVAPISTFGLVVGSCQVLSNFDTWLVAQPS